MFEEAEGVDLLQNIRHNNEAWFILPDCFSWSFLSGSWMDTKDWVESLNLV